MALDVNLRDVTAGTAVGVTTANELKVAGDVVFYSENDDGSVTGTRLLESPETDDDYRLRIAHENYLDQETFNYTAQNTGKYRYFNATMTNAWTASGMQTNSANATVAGNATFLQTWAYFPIHGIASTYFQFNGAFTATFPTATSLEFGAFISPAAAASPTAPYTPADGVYFRATNAGLQGVINFNGTETSTPIFASSFGGTDWTPTANQKYNFTITVNERNVQFWIDNVLYGQLAPILSQGQPFISASLPMAVRHAITGTPSSNFSFIISDTTVSFGGPITSDRLSSIGNRTLGSYQGLSGGTMGSLASYVNNTNPTPAALTNTAALVTGLGGQAWETPSIAVNTDGILMAYQVPFGTTAIQGRRLVVRGVALQSYIQTVIAGGPFNVQYVLAYGHSGTSVGTAPAMTVTETANTKAPRRIPLPQFTQLVTAAQAVNTFVSQPGGAYIDFGDAPIYVNPGEWICLVKKHVGTVATTGTIAHMVSFTYGWE